MKPSEMSNEELALWLRAYDETGNRYLQEIATRLRNSIPKPVVEVLWSDDGTYYELFIDDTFIMGDEFTGHKPNELATNLRTALGINGTEGAGRGCDRACSPSDWCSGGYCDRMGCYTEGGE